MRRDGLVTWYCKTWKLESYSNLKSPNDLRLSCQKVTIFSSHYFEKICWHIINRASFFYFFQYINCILSLLLDYWMLVNQYHVLYKVLQNHSVFDYFEILLSVQEETGRNEGKKKNKQKTGVGLNSMSLKTKHDWITAFNYTCFQTYVHRWHLLTYHFSISYVTWPTSII